MPKRDPGHMQAQRERILRAMIECIAEYGVEGASIARLTARAGLSAGAIYVHFANRDEVLAATLRYGTITASELPANWAAFKARALNYSEQLGFDFDTTVRARLHLHAESVPQGRLHDLYKPILQEGLATVVSRLEAMAETGQIRLRTDARSTAEAIVAYVDGMLWLALALDRPLGELRPELDAGLDQFVELPEPPSALT